MIKLQNSYSVILWVNIFKERPGPVIIKSCNAFYFEKYIITFLHCSISTQVMKMPSELNLKQSILLSVKTLSYKMIIRERQYILVSQEVSSNICIPHYLIKCLFTHSK